MSTIQVNPDHYQDNIYDSKERFISYWHQINELTSLKPKKILEIGLGNGFVSKYLQERGYDITTVDFDKELKPDIVADIRKLPLKDKTFDVVACFEVLEHIPYENAMKGLTEMHRVSKKHVVISLPDAHLYYPLTFCIPKFKYIKKLIKIPTRNLPKHEYDGQHYWEIGKKNFDLNKIMADIQDHNFSIITTYSLFEHPYHRFFVLQKSK